MTSSLALGRANGRVNIQVCSEAHLDEGDGRLCNVEVARLQSPVIQT